MSSSSSASQARTAAPENEASSTTASPADRAARLILRLDAEGCIRQIDAPGSEGLGLDPDALVTTSLFHHMHERDLMPVFRGMAELVEGRREEVPVGFHLRTPGGLWQAVQGTMRLCSSGHAIAGLLLTLQLLTALG